MKKFFSLVLALVMALSLTTVAWGATEITTEQQLKDAIATGGDYKLMNDITLTTNWTPVNVNNELTLDGNGKTIYGLTITQGTKPSIAMGYGEPRDLAFALISENKKPVTFKNLTIDGANVTAVTGAGYASVLVGSACADITLEKVTIKNSTVTGQGWTSLVASYLYFLDNLTVTDCTFSNNTLTTNGQAGVLVALTNGKDVAVNDTTANGCSVSTTSTDEDHAAGGLIGVVNGASDVTLDDTTLDGSTLAVGKILGSSDVTVDGYQAGFAAQVGNYSYAKVEDAVTVANGATVILLDASATIPDGYTALANGTVVTTPAASATDPVLYKWDNAGAEWDAYFIATGKTLDKLAQDASDDCLPCYLINGEYFVEVKEAAATYKLVYGAKTVFLAPIAEKLVKYDDTASVLTVVDAEDAECGDYYVTNLDEDDVYYISYNKKGEVDGIWVKAKNGSEQILVNGKIVDAEDASSDVTFMFHKFKGYDVVNKQYTTVKCENCPKVAKLYANATAATVGKKDAVKIDTLGWITFADYMDFGANAPVVTDKVQSADTFDAGIAMYVGMSVMAAAGSAVVIGKKRED